MKQCFQNQNHTYETFIYNCSWEKAFEICLSKDGHLVTFDDEEEYLKIINQKIFDEYKDIIFYVGGNRSLEEEEFYWNDKSAQHYGTILNSEDNWCNSYWHAGEPTLVYGDNQECYMAMQWDSKAERWGFLDIVNDLSEGYFKGKIGFICEYS